VADRDLVWLIKEVDMVSKTNSSGSYSDRASDLLSRARGEATTPRLIAAGAVAAGAGAYALLRDADRRERLTTVARSYADRVASWWNESRGRSEKPTAAEITLP
jgi:hypothetical protein